MSTQIGLVCRQKHANRFMAISEDCPDSW